MRHPRRITASLLGLGLTASGAAVAGPASAAVGGRVDVLTTAVMAPFQMAVAGSSVYVSDGFAGTLRRIDGDGSSRVVASNPGGEIAGVAISGGALAYTWTDRAGDTTTASGLTVRAAGHNATVNLLAYEKRVNPDQKVVYGLDHPTKCQADGLAAAHIPARYTGVVDSHPYAVASLGAGWVVAEAAGNALLKVGANGAVSTLTVMPRQPTTITASAAAGFGLPKCLVGAVYNFEAVPTAVSTGPDGMLYVSTLPGGPESPALGARGSVYRVDPTTGGTARVATGFLGATNVSVNARGTIYVAELFAGKVTRINLDGRGRATAATRAGALAVATAGGHLYLSTLVPTDENGNPLPGKTGKVLRLW